MNFLIIILTTLTFTLAGCSKLKEGTKITYEHSVGPDHTPGGFGVLDTCAEFQEFNTITECNKETFAECAPTIHEQAGMPTITCAKPVQNWERCRPNPSTWKVDAWRNWCFIPTTQGYTTYNRSRTVNCTKSFSQCVCVDPKPANTETCIIHQTKPEQTTCPPTLTTANRIIRCDLNPSTEATQ